MSEMISPISSPSGANTFSVMLSHRQWSIITEILVTSFYPDVRNAEEVLEIVETIRLNAQADLVERGTFGDE